MVHGQGQIITIAGWSDRIQIGRMKPVLWLSIFVLSLIDLNAAESPALDEIRSRGGKISEDGKRIELQHARQCGDADLKLIAGLESVEILNLRDTAITNAGLQHLAQMGNLRRLHLERTKIGDAAYCRDDLAGILKPLRNQGD